MSHTKPAAGLALCLTLLVPAIAHARPVQPSEQRLVRLTRDYAQAKARWETLLAQQEAVGAQERQARDEYARLNKPPSPQPGAARAAQAQAERLYAERQYLLTKASHDGAAMSAKLVRLIAFRRSHPALIQRLEAGPTRR